MRIAEQRIGRIDQMNSPHDQVEIFFPDDHPEFALKTDRKFFLTAQIVDDMIGGNVDLPEEMLDKWEVEVISGKEIAQNYRKRHEEAAQSFADGIQDAFQKVRALVQGAGASMLKFLSATLTYGSFRAVVERGGVHGARGETSCGVYHWNGDVVFL